MTAARRSRLTSFVLLLLLLNALPAFVVLEAAPGDTENWFVWTIHPDANARVLGVMYGNAFLLALTAWLGGSWAAARVAMLVVVPFSVAATAVTFSTLDPFLAHPRYELAYWIANYVVLCVCAPLAFTLEERRHRPAVRPEERHSAVERGGVGVLAGGLAVFGVSLLFQLPLRSALWPFAITPLVSRMLGVWFSSLALAHMWVAVEGDRHGARALGVASPMTGALLALVPLVQRDDVSDAGALAPYLALAVGLAMPALSLLARDR